MGMQEILVIPRFGVNMCSDLCMGYGVGGRGLRVEGRGSFSRGNRVYVVGEWFCSPVFM